MQSVVLQSAIHRQLHIDWVLQPAAGQHVPGSTQLVDAKQSSRLHQHYHQTTCYTRLALPL